jgi:hypothetical protein
MGAGMSELDDLRAEIAALQKRMDRIDDFLVVVKTAVGHLWSWLQKNVLGGVDAKK